jgi:hypothetical protein
LFECTRRGARVPRSNHSRRKKQCVGTKWTLAMANAFLKGPSHSESELSLQILWAYSHFPGRRSAGTGTLHESVFTAMKEHIEAQAAAEGTSAAVVKMLRADVVANPVVCPPRRHVHLPSTLAPLAGGQLVSLLPRLVHSPRHQRAPGYRPSAHALCAASVPSLCRSLSCCAQGVASGTRNARRRGS